MIVDITNNQEETNCESLDQSLIRIIEIMNQHSQEEVSILFIAISSAILYSFPKENRKSILDIFCNASLEMIDRKEKGLI